MLKSDIIKARAVGGRPKAKATTVKSAPVKPTVRTKPTVKAVNKLMGAKPVTVIVVGKPSKSSKGKPKSKC